MEVSFYVVTDIFLLKNSATPTPAAAVRLAQCKRKPPPDWRRFSKYWHCAPGWTRTNGAHWAGDLQSPVIAAIRPAHLLTKAILADFGRKVHRKTYIKKTRTSEFL